MVLIPFMMLNSLQEDPAYFTREVTMKKHMLKIVFLAVAAAIFGCGPAVGPQVADDIHEKLIYSTAPERPAWTMEEPETVDGVMSFVGTSKRHAAEQSAREDARRNVIEAVVKYMGTLAKDKFEAARVSYGLESSVIDSTESTREFQKQLATNMATNVKVKSWYGEKWQTPTGIGWQYFAKAEVPQEAIDGTFKKTASDQARKAEQQAKEAADAIAKAEAEKAADFWKQMQDQGLTE